MIVRINNVAILDESSVYHMQRQNVTLEDGRIIEIGNNSSHADLVVESGNLIATPGLFDMRVSFGDPGLEHKEDIESVSRAAIYGGITDILAMPSTKPAVHSKDVIGYIKNKSVNTSANIHIAAAVTHDRLGKDLTEMIDLHHAGAVAFTDGDKPIWHPDIFLKSLQYLQTFDGLLIDHAEELHLTHSGQMNESLQNTILGLKGIPKLAEEIAVERNLSILEYTGGRLHFAHISSPKSLEKIRMAKSKGLRVTCDISVHHLVLDDTFLQTFDTNYKINPPLREKQDILHFWEAIADDTIDVIVSDHNPQDEESKNLEFDLAEFGILGLETLFPLLNTYKPDHIPLHSILKKISTVPRNLLKLQVPPLKEGAMACLTLFDPDIEWEYSAKDIKSKSRNTPYVGTKFKGKIIGVVNKGKVYIN